MLKKIKKIRSVKKNYNLGTTVLEDGYHNKAKNLSQFEITKRPFRFDVINHLLKTFKKETTYLEIGVRDPSLNYDKIDATKKYSVDPGLEFKKNPVDFKVTSDEFFMGIKENSILSKDVKFDVIFIDGLHTAEQANRDITNSLKYITENGFVILHDCNPPTVWHAREEHGYRLSPAGNNWNGTTWKAFVKWRMNPEVQSCCVDTDWGVGIISKTQKVGNHCSLSNSFYEYKSFESHRKEFLNLISFNELLTMVPIG